MSCFGSRSSQSSHSEKCPVCGIELLKKNMIKHQKECSRFSSSCDATGHLHTYYNGPKYQDQYQESLRLSGVDPSPSTHSHTNSYSVGSKPKNIKPPPLPDPIPEKRGFSSNLFSPWSSNSTPVRICPHCHIKLNENEMMNHINSCYSTSFTKNGDEFSGRYQGAPKRLNTGMEEFSREFDRNRQGIKMNNGEQMQKNSNFETN